jgi:hypothetical protein
MTLSTSLAPVLGAAPAESRAALVAVAPAAVGIAVALVLITAVAVVALVVEVRRDGYGIERPRPLSTEFPWQTERIAPRRRVRRGRDSWSVLRASRAAHR